MKEVATLQAENTLLRELLAAEQHKNKVEKDKVAERDAKIAELKEQLKYLLNRRYGPSSEKTSPDQLGLFNEAEAIIAEVEPEPSTPVKSHSRQRKPRISIPAELPREDIIHDLPEAEKLCPHDGSVLTLIGSEDHGKRQTNPTLPRQSLKS